MEAMKRFHLGMLLPLLVLPLSGCTWFDDSHLFEEYGTPEKFFSKPIYEAQTVLSHSWTGNHCKDVGLKVKNAFVEHLPFSEGSKPTGTPPSEFASYYVLIAHATSGPNYVEMLLYADGNVVIDCKSSLGSHHYGYYRCPADTALELCSFVYQTIEAAAYESSSLK